MARLIQQLDLTPVDGQIGDEAWGAFFNSYQRSCSKKAIAALSALACVSNGMAVEVKAGKEAA